MSSNTAWSHKSLIFNRTETLNRGLAETISMTETQSLFLIVLKMHLMDIVVNLLKILVILQVLQVFKSMNVLITGKEVEFQRGGSWYLNTKMWLVLP